MELRDVEFGDVDAYVRMRCDPVMMAELGGPQPRAGIEDKVRRDVADVQAGNAWIKMIVPDAERPDLVAGNVVLWTQDSHPGTLFSEIGWMVLPEFQGQGLGKRAVAALLDLARADGRWGLVHAFPGVTNAPSNGICRSLGFQFHGPEEIVFSGRLFQSNHWSIPTTD